MGLEKHFTITKSARCFFSRDITKDDEEVVIVLHGYGQSAEYFLKKFESIQSDKRVVLAPEGLHRFYTKGFSGRVGASWMTKEDRLNDISDYIGYLDRVYDICHSANENAKISVIGFSQGAATATRWICQGRHKVDRFVLWAGSFPHDVDFPSQSARLQDLNFEIVVGNQDEFIKEEHIKDVRLLLQENQIEFDLIQYEGGHDIHNPTLQKLFGA